MAWRLYLIPLETVADPVWGTVTRPKYIAALGVNYASMNYGRIGESLVAADVTNAQNTTLDANADVSAFPLNLDNNVGAANLTTVRAELESHRLPGNWIEATTTYRIIARRIAGLFQLAQRHSGLHNEELIPSIAALDLTWGEIALDRRARIQQSVESFGWTLSEVTDTMLVRQVLGILADQWGTSTFYLGGLTF